MLRALWLLASGSLIVVAFARSAHSLRTRASSAAYPKKGKIQKEKKTKKLRCLGEATKLCPMTWVRWVDFKEGKDVYSKAINKLKSAESEKKWGKEEKESGGRKGERKRGRERGSGKP